MLDITKNDEDNSESGIEDSKSIKKQIKNDRLEDEEDSGIVDSEVLKSEIQFLKDELEKEKEISEKKFQNF